MNEQLALPFSQGAPGYVGSRVKYVVDVEDFRRKLPRDGPCGFLIRGLWPRFGDVVLVKTRYTGLKPHKIVALGQGHGFLYMLGAIKTAEELAAYGKPLPVAHHPLYQIDEVEQLSKSHFTDRISERYIKGLVAEAAL